MILRTYLFVDIEYMKTDTQTILQHEKKLKRTLSFVDGLGSVFSYLSAQKSRDKGRDRDYGSYS